MGDAAELLQFVLVRLAGGGRPWPMPLWVYNTLETHDGEEVVGLFDSYADLMAAAEPLLAGPATQ